MWLHLTGLQWGDMQAGKPASPRPPLPTDAVLNEARARDEEDDDEDVEDDGPSCGVTSTKLWHFNHKKAAERGMC